MSDKQKIELEFLLNCSSKVLYNCLVTPSGLSEWFADDVNIRNDLYTFFWNGDEQVARLVRKKRDEQVRYQWVDDEDDADDGTYFEFQIKIDPITGDTALLVSDFVDEDEVEEATQLWETQIEMLKRNLGS